MDSLYSLDVSHLDKDLKDKNAVHKRRSSVFQSRTIVFDNDEENEKMVDDKDAARCVSKISDVG
ncbi:hypothetical protein WN48_04781 [Eufriesea mexicana]|uniref:Uncharacterized protein n=1 Tax=Eufriesea mexicana TaxID=516756 RepID=A0A310SSW9_9HYME|nr:hypothetical protein WN48_04781 [Eufriesea mexicana]